jgi:hypothetical protein
MLVILGGLINFHESEKRKGSVSAFGIFIDLEQSLD